MPRPAPGPRSAVPGVFLLMGILCLTSCSGGGSGGGLEGDASLISIRAAGSPEALWSAPGITPSACPTNLPLNTPVLFDFAGAVDPSSLPPAGPAIGAINITVPGAGGAPSMPAYGSFRVEDDPSLPAGNARRVRFSPLLPSNPAAPLSAGLQPLQSYTVFVPSGQSTAQSVVVAGQSLQNTALTCFTTCTPAPNAPAATCFVDPVPGSAFILETWPPTGDPAPPPIDPASLTPGSGTNPFASQPNTVTIFISEPIVPAGINLQNVRLVLDAGPNQVQVPGTLQLFAAGSPEAGPDRTRIDYVASSPLLGDATYRIEFSNQVLDYGGNPIESFPGGAPGVRSFATAAIAFCAQPTIVEEFDDAMQRADSSSPEVARWSDDGAVTATFPVEHTGTGAFGPLVFGPGNHSLDTGMPASTVGGLTAFERGAWHTSMVLVDVGAVVRIRGPFPAHLRCTGSITVNGELDANAGADSLAPPGSANQGPQAGRPNNGQFAMETIALGGVGGPGAGRGGSASQNGAQRTPQGEAGFGASLDDGNPNPGTAIDTFAGGPGGEGGFFPPMMPGEVGGLGGAGGSAWEPGTAGQPQLIAAACAPAMVPQTVAQPLPVPLAFMGPLSGAIGIRGGSGGGGGGDHFDFTGVNGDDQGGGGGGGGGGLRLSCIGDLSLGSMGRLECSGQTGANAALFGGSGGAGSGGQVWCQSFSNILIDGAAWILVRGGDATVPCTLYQGGEGGDGLCQLEDTSLAGPSTNFVGSADQMGQNIFTPPFPFSGSVTGSVTSRFFDTGYGAPRYTGATLDGEVGNVSLGDAPGAGLTIVYEGAPESLTTPGAPDLSQISPPVSGANIAALDGLRFIRFRITVTYAAPPTTTLTNLLPSVQRIEIDYAAPFSCQ